MRNTKRQHRTAGDIDQTSQGKRMQRTAAASKSALKQQLTAARDVIRDLAHLGVVHDYPKNVVIMTQGDVSDAVYVVLSGRIQVYLSGARGRRVVLGVYGAGECVGEMELNQRRRCASVRTLEPCRLALLTGEQFWAFISSAPGAASHLIEILVRRARLATETIRVLALMSAYERVSRFLAALAVEDATGLVVEKVTQREIAEHTACSREMVSRILKELHDRGSIVSESRRIRIVRALPASA